MLYLIDTSAWVEFFLGTSKGKKVQTYLANGAAITSDATIGELVSWGIRESQNVPALIDIVHKKSAIREIYLNLWVEAAHIKSLQRKSHAKFGLIDGLLVALQQANNATIITADNDFRGMKNVIVI